MFSPQRQVTMWPLMAMLTSFIVVIILQCILYQNIILYTLNIYNSVNYNSTKLGKNWGKECNKFLSILFLRFPA